MVHRRGWKAMGLVWLIVCFMGAGCATERGAQVAPQVQETVAASPEVPGPAASALPEEPAKPGEAAPSRAQRPEAPLSYQGKSPGSDGRLLSPPARAARDGKKVTVEVAFDAADLYQVLDATLFQLYDMNYMIDPSIQAKVSFRAKGSYTRWEFLRLLNDVLQLSGLALVPGPGDMIKIVRKQMAPGASNFQGDGQEGADVTRMIRLRYLSAETAAANIGPFLSPGAVVVPDKMGNSLVITDTASNIEKAAAILSAMDMDFVGQVSWQVFPLRYVEAEQTAQEITKILSTQGLYTRPGTDGGGFVVLPINTINGVMVASRWPSIIDQVRRWITIMDVPVREGSGGIYVYFVQNGSAKELAELLTEIYKTEGRKTSEHPSTQVVVPSAASRPEAGKKTSAPKPASAATVGAARPSGEVAFIADEATNSIVIRASEADYRAVQAVLRQLDVVPRQVLIGVVSAEISLSGSVEYGLEWFLQGHWDEYTGQVIWDDQTGRSLTTALGSGTGFAATVFDGAQFLRGLIHALGKDSELTILSTPNIMASDNKDAYIEVAEEVPVVTGEVTSQEATAVTRTIQYRKTGIILKVTPHINAGGLVKLDISQEVSERGERDEELKTTSIISRKAETSMVVHDGQTVIIGGLMSKSESVSRSGVPGLRNLPLLKHLFGTTTRENGRTELILLITPHVVRSQQEAQAVTAEFSTKIRRVMELMKKENTLSGP